MTLKYQGQHVMRVGQKFAHEFKTTTKQQKEDKEVNANAAKLINTLAAGILARAKDDEKRQLAATQSHPDPPPACILAKTPAQEEVERHYQKPDTIRTNVNNIRGLESYEPPPVLLAPIEKETK